MASNYGAAPSFRVQKGETDAAKRTIYYVIATDEAQVITVSKAGGAFDTSGGSAETTVDGLLSKLVLHVDDIDTLGQLGIKSAGATDTQYIWGEVVDYDPYTEGAKSDRAQRYDSMKPS